MPNPQGNNVLISTGIWLLLFHDTTFLFRGSLSDQAGSAEGRFNLAQS